MKKDHILSLFLIAAILFVFFLTVRALMFGAFAFWFDPARDLGLGLANLKKLSLIGHPSGGLPGLFYGPYYIWLISFAELFSRDPRWVWFAFATVPYFTLFPFILYKFRKYGDTVIALTFWLLFLLSFNNYSQVWNPNPTPIMYLFVVYFASFAVFRKTSGLIYALLTGLAAGLIANFHMSYGIGIILSFFIAFAVDITVQFFLKSGQKVAILKNKAIALLAYGAGVFVTYIPFLLFEVRHGFNQVKILMANFQLGITKGTSLNIGQGFDKAGVFNYFFVQGEKLLHIPSMFILILTAGSLAYIIYIAYRKKKAAFTPDEKRLLVLVLFNALTVLFIFLTTKNPVYDYFFISVEMFFLLPALVIAKKIPVAKYFFLAIAFYLVVMRVSSEIKSAGVKNTSSNYGSKLETVKLIYKDVQKPPFTVFVYDPAIYTFDYDYIIGMHKEKFGFEPKREKSDDRTVYVVLPESKNQGALQSFADYHTPDTQYRTAKRWHMNDGTVVLKRERID